jgi:NAD(P)H-dependent FMN reductase
MTRRPDRFALATLVGSTRNERCAPTVAAWFVGHARARSDFDLDVIDLAASDLPAVLSTRSDRPEPVRALSERLAVADAFVVVTPEYNHSYPASLKKAVDWFREEWYTKPVGFVSYGGAAGGLRAVEHLRNVFAELHALTVRNTVSLHNFWDQFDRSGNLVSSTGSERAADRMLDQLAWWARASRSARGARRYPA